MAAADAPPTAASPPPLRGLLSHRPTHAGLVEAYGSARRRFRSAELHLEIGQHTAPQWMIVSGVLLAANAATAS